MKKKCGATPGAGKKSREWLNISNERWNYVALQHI